MSDSGSNPDVQQQVFDEYQRLVIENYCIIASSALLFFDYAITATTEVQRVWHRRFTGATVVFFLTRYIALAERITLLVSLFLVTIDDKVLVQNARDMSRHNFLIISHCFSCVPVLRLDDTLTDLNYVAIGAFTALRLFGVYGKAWAPLIIIALIWTARVTVSVYLQVTYIPIAFGPPLYGCGALFIPTLDTIYRFSTLTESKSVQTCANALVIVSDTFLLVLTWVKTLGIKRESTRLGFDAPLATLLLRDGTIYFVLILIIQIIAIVSVDVGFEFILFDVWTYFAQVFIVIFLSRFILNLRGVYLADGIETTTPQLTSDIRFTSNVIIGNLGAPIDTEANTSTTVLLSADHYKYYDDDQSEEVSMNPLFVGLKKSQKDIEMT